MGAAGDDQVVANPYFMSTLAGLSGNDTPWGSAFGDVMSDGDGNDILLVQGSADTMFGGAGNDYFVVSDANAVISENLGEGQDRVVFNGSFGNLFIGENVEEGELKGSATAIIGNAGNNLLIANASGVGSNIKGGAGDDVILGSTGRDTIEGGAGNDWLIGGGGEDVFVYDARGGWGNDNIFGYIPRTSFNANDGSKHLFTNAVGPYAPVMVQAGGGNSYVFIPQRPDLGTITIHGAVVQASDFLF